MAETGIHVNVIMCLHSSLRSLLRDYRGRENFYIASDMNLYYEQGNPRAVKAPDTMLIEGVDGSYERRSWKVWLEGAVPSVVFEITSEGTWGEDWGNKRELYASLGIEEYFIFDPLEEYLRPSLVGFTLRDAEYQEMEPNENDTLYSRQLDAYLGRRDLYLRLFDAQTGHMMLWDAEQTQRIRQVEQRAEQQAQRAEQEAQRAEQAEAENARLRALLDQQNK